MGFFTDTSVCIGCKACEVACKEWNEVPEDGYLLTGMSYDNTQALGASTWRHVAFVEKPLHPTTTDLGLPGMGPPGCDSHESGLPHGEDQAAESGDGGIRWLMSSDVCKHCTHAACLDVCPTGAAVPHRVRHGRRPARRLQRLRLLRPGLSLRRHRPAQGGRPGLQVHAVLRPAQGRPDPGLRAGVPHRVDPVRRGRRAAPAGRPAGGRAAREGRRRRPALRPRPRRRRRRRRRVLPAARRARGLRAAARPGGDHPRPRLDLAARRRGRRRPGRRRRRLVPRDGAGEGAARMVPEPEFESYYGRQILKTPTWKTPDVPLYLFLGGLAGASAVLAEGAAFTGNARARAGRPARGRRAARLPAPWSWCTTWAGPSASCTCCASSSPPLRCRSAPSSSRRSVRSRRLRPRSPASPVGCPGSGGWPALGAAAFGPPLATYTGGAARQHRRSGLARGAPRAAVRLRRVRRHRGRWDGACCSPRCAQAGPARRMAIAGAAVELAAAEVLLKRGSAWSRSPTSRAVPVG